MYRSGAQPRMKAQLRTSGSTGVETECQITNSAPLLIAGAADGSPQKVGGWWRT